MRKSLWPWVGQGFLKQNTKVQTIKEKHDKSGFTKIQNFHLITFNLKAPYKIYRMSIIISILQMKKLKQRTLGNKARNL